MIKNTFLGHFKRNTQTHRHTDSQTHGRKVGVTELHVAAKKSLKNKRTYEKSQSCDLVHLGHLKFFFLKKLKKKLKTNLR